ncbi:MAG: hypothetical protein WC736_15520 [Gallionella sp.]
MRPDSARKSHGPYPRLQIVDAPSKEAGALGMTDEEFQLLLASARIPRGSKREHDYLEARKWAGTVAADRGDYERLVQLAANYVGV